MAATYLGWPFKPFAKIMAALCTNLDSALSLAAAYIIIF